MTFITANSIWKMRKQRDMKKIKRLFLFVPLIAALAFAGCMTAQVEIRMEYDKLTKAITAQEDKRDDYLAPAANDDVKAVLEYIYNVTKQTKEMVETFAGKEKSFIDGINPGFCAMFMQSVPKDGKNQSQVTEFPYYIKDVKISVMTFGLSVKNVSGTEKIAEALFMLSVTGTATDKDGVVLKHNNTDITYTSMVILVSAFNPLAPVVISFHKYKISADSKEIPVYNLIYDYAKIGGEWKINGIKDGDSEIYPLEELTS